MVERSSFRLYNSILMLFGDYTALFVRPSQSCAAHVEAKLHVTHTQQADADTPPSLETSADLWFQRLIRGFVRLRFLQN